MHPFIKAAGCKTEAEFLKKYDSPEKFFQSYPQYNKSDLEQNQTLTSPGSAKQSFDFTNTDTKTDRGEDSSLPRRQVGGTGGESEQNLGIKSNNIFKKGGKVKMTQGGPNPQIQIEETGLYPIKTGENQWNMHQPNYLVGDWSQMGSSANLVKSMVMPPVAGQGYVPTSTGQAQVQQDNWHTSEDTNYNMHGGSSEEMKKGGKFKMKKLKKAQEGMTNLPDNTNSAWTNVQQPINSTDVSAGMHDPNIDYSQLKPNTYAPGVTGDFAQPPGHATQSQRNGPSTGAMIGAGVAGVVGGFLGFGALNNKMQTAKDLHSFTQQNGLTKNSGINEQGTMGDTDQFGNFRPDQRTPSQPGMFYPKVKYGGTGTWVEESGVYFQEGGQPNFSPGQVIDVSPEQVQQLIKQGFKIQRL